MRDTRNQLTHAQVHAYSHSAMMHFVHADIFHHNQHFACYLAQDGEIDTALFIEHIFEYKKCCYLPTLDQDHMLFARYVLGDHLRANRFNILEPDITQANHRDAKDMDVILTPLVGFDDQGQRLGMGGGFYDRTLAFLAHRSHRHPLLVGFGF